MKILKIIDGGLGVLMLAVAFIPPVDNWLSFFLLISGLSFIYSAVMDKDP